MLLCSNSSLAVWVRLNRMCTTCLLLVVWRGCFIISWDKIWSQLLIDLNSPDMTVNPNPLCRAQWLFSTSLFFFFWLSPAQPSHVSLALPWLFPVFFSPPWPWTPNTTFTTYIQHSLHCDETCPYQAWIPGYKFALSQKHSAQDAAQGASSPWAVGNKTKAVLWYENTPHFL